MYNLNLPRTKKELILIRPIKRSNYLKNLEKQRCEGLKYIEEEKANILIDKILKKGTIFRDYSIFSKNTNNNNIKSINNIKKDNYITNYNSYNFKNKMQKKKIIHYSTDIHKNNNVLNTMSKETFITRNLGRKNFLSIIGDDIINSNYLSNDSRKRKKNFI